jgi:hypothetical protein
MIDFQKGNSILQAIEKPLKPRFKGFFFFNLLYLIGGRNSINLSGSRPPVAP